MFGTAYHTLKSTVDFFPLCYEVEPNPGPTTEQMLTMILEAVRELKSNFYTVTQRLNETTNKLPSMDSKLDGFASSVCRYTRKVDELQRTVDSLLIKVNDLENRSRRNNLVVYGVSEPTV